MSCKLRKNKKFFKMTVSKKKKKNNKTEII